MRLSFWVALAEVVIVERLVKSDVERLDAHAGCPLDGWLRKTVRSGG
jgi:hypothetical protein